MSHMVANFLTEIVQRVLHPERGDLSVEVARYFLSLHLEQRDRDRMEELGLKANRGTLSPDETKELNSYLDVCLSLDILHAKARLSLKAQSVSAA
jgi:hypothetical protein